jgi:hypothetical protein
MNQDKKGATSASNGSSFEACFKKWQGTSQQTHPGQQGGSQPIDNKDSVFSKSKTGSSPTGKNFNSKDKGPSRDSTAGSGI